MLHSHPAKSTKWILTAAALLSVALIAGCDEYVTSERNPEVPIPKHATWAWRPAEAQPAPSDSRPISLAGRTPAGS